MQVRMRPNTTVKFLYPIIPSGIKPSIGIGPTQGQRKTLTRVGFEPTTFFTPNATEGQQLAIT